MNVDDVIQLEDNNNYGLLLKADLDECNYFLAVKLNEKEEPTNEYKVLKEINDDAETYVQEINDPLILSQLLEEYSMQYDETYND